ncbi:MAG TPA: hypothetical protein VMY80_00565 [Anaerolineae bacterium]|nr:hypothetical protein [Anaerolineae bacterium]
MKQAAVTGGLGRLAALALFLVVSAAVVRAQAGGAVTLPGAGYDLSWFTIDGGGGTASSEGYTLTGTAGQPEPGAALQGGGYVLIGGFWPGAAAGCRLYLPLVLKSWQ